MKVPSKRPKEEPREKIDPKAMRKSYLEKMEKSLSNKGVVFFDSSHLNISEDYLTLPPEITDVPSRELGEYLSAFTQQKVYLRTLLGQCDLLAEEAKRAYYEASDSVYRKYSLEKMSETAKDRLVNANPDVRPLYYEYVDTKKKCGLIESSISNIEDIIFMLSREVTRRTGDFAEENRAYSVGGMRR